MMVVVVASILLDLLQVAWVEWRRFLWGELAMRVWEKRFVVTEKAVLMLRRPRERS